MPSLGREVEQRRRDALLTQLAVFAALFALSTCLTGSHSCPRSLDCARAGRHFCQPGSLHCGSCLSPLVENSHGRCVVKRRPIPHFGKVTTYPELDEEIDIFSTIIGEQLETDKLPAPPAQDALNLKEEEPNVPGPTQTSTSEPSTNQSTLSATTPSHTTTNHTTTNHTSALRSGPAIVPYPSNDHVFIVMSSVFIVTGSLFLILAGVCWIRSPKGVRLAQKMDYPAYGVMGPRSYDNNVPGDKNLAHSAQMYHYQHQKQQMLSLEKHRDEPKVSDSGATSDEENEDGDFTVYECPGLAPTGEMEVKNPLFDDSTLYLQRFHK